jgi:hypothetical protein
MIPFIRDGKDDRGRAHIVVDDSRDCPRAHTGMTDNARVWCFEGSTHVLHSVE